MWAPPLEAIVAVFLLAVASIGAGSVIRKSLPRALDRPGKIACTWLAGFGLISLVLFLIGQWKFTRVEMALVFALPLLLGVRLLPKLPTAVRGWAARSQIPRLPALIVVSVLLVCGLAGLAEVVGDSGSDTVAYHLLGPKVWLRTGVIRPVPDDCHTAMPQTAETMYAALMAFGGPRAPGFSNVLTLALLLLLAGSLALRCGLSASWSWWAAALVAAMPAVCSGASGAFVDVLYAAFALVAVRVGFDAASLHEWAVFGLFGGLMMATKYPGLLAFPAVLLCALLAAAPPRKFDRQLLQRVGIAAGVSALIASPYYLRNWILLGSPIDPPAPLLWRIFPIKYMSPQTAMGFLAYIRARGHGLGTGPSAFLLLPFNLTFHTSSFHGGGGIGICALALGPIGLAASRRDPFARALALLALLLTALWFVTQQESRFLIHVYVIGAIFAVRGWRYAVSIAPKYSRGLAAAAVALSICYGLFMIAKDRVGDIHSVFSPAAAEARRRADIPFLQSFDYLNRDPAVQRVLILDGSVPPFYSDKPYVKPVGAWGERTLPGAPDQAEALERLPEWNVSHVLDIQSETSPFQVSPDMKGLTLVFQAQGQRIYRVDGGLTGQAPADPLKIN